MRPSQTDHHEPRLAAGSAPPRHEARDGPSARAVGIDVGSVSLNVAVVDGRGHVVEGFYERTFGQPLPRLLDALRRLGATVGEAAVCGTGSGRPLLADVLGLVVHNEIVAHAWGAVHFHPEARTIVEIGGQDSKLILLDGRAPNGSPIIRDHAMNEICAAGTGSFLDQQAARLGVAIEEEFGALALQSERPPAVAGRCSVFAKSDMIHLQQQGYPKEDIVAGLCYALARNYLSNLGRGRRLHPPVLFQGGVAANQGVAKAFEDLLGLAPGQLVIPQHHNLMGAIGAALMARAGTAEPVPLADLIARLEAHLARPRATTAALPVLRPRQAPAPSPGYRAASPATRTGPAWGGLCADAEDPLADDAPARPPSGEPLVLGIDVGSVSTNLVLVDRGGEVRDELYLYTEGDPVETVRYGLGALGDSFPQPPLIAAVGVTGSGRHLIGDFVGADLVINEISAQARAATEIDPEADTVFEIGGQDSKFIRLREGAVADFEMNKVCAAGTGAFLAEQATRLDIRIDEGFSRLAFEAQAPVDLGSRCTVFMESDLIHHQQQGAAKADLVAGLAYAIARNYLEKVVGHKPIGERILFQGGVASNPSVVAAFENLLDRPITVPPWSRATGAIGAALLARDARTAATAGGPSRFRGFDLSNRSYRTQSFTCEGCPNRCEIKKVVLDGEAVSYYGSVCGKYDTRTGPADGPDLFAEREAMLLDGWEPDGPAPDAPAVGIPRVLLFHELFPEWCAFFQSLGYRVVLSDPTNRRIIHQGLEHVVVETCFPIKVAYGHIVDLLDKGVERIFLPAIVEQPRADSDRKSFNCPFVQNIPAFIRAAFPRLELLEPAITCAGRKSTWRRAMGALARALGHGGRAIDRALSAARGAQRRFERRRDRRGREILASLRDDQTAVVLFGRSYNTCDHALSMQAARKLRERGAVVVPLDFLPMRDVELDPAWDDLVWKIGLDFAAAGTVVRQDPRLHPVVITNFSCGPDSLLVSNVIEELFAGRPALTLEVDEHFADVGVVTRCEAFLHEIRSRRAPVDHSPVRPRCVHVLTREHRHMSRTVYVPSDSEHFYAIWAAFRSIGVEAHMLTHQRPVWGASRATGITARLLPPPDEHTEELGRRYTLSRGCLPFVHFAGDAVRMTELPGFEPARSAFAIPGNDEACRLNQFPRGLRHILDRLGAEETLVVAPRVGMERDEAYEVFGPRFERHLWLGLVAIDLLYHKRFETRPYEITPGGTDAAFHHHVPRVAAAIGTAGFLDAVLDALRALDGVETATRGTRPRIGLLGDRYMQVNSFLNNDLVRAIEALGGEVWLTPYFTDGLRAQGHLYPRRLLRMGRLAAAMLNAIRHIVQMRDYNALERLFAPFLANQHEPTFAQMLDYAEPYLSPEMDVAVIANIAKAVDYARKGCAGLINLVPLGCLLANAAATSFPLLRSHYSNLPVLNLVFDGLQDTNQRTRLEAFMHQVAAPAAPARRPALTAHTP